MKIAKAIALLGAIAQGVVLIYGFTKGDLTTEGAFFTQNPWGIVSLVDVYVGFMFFIAWIFYREKTLLASIFWAIAILILGNFPAGVYAFIALEKSENDWKKFFMGKHAQ